MPSLVHECEPSLWTTTTQITVSTVYVKENVTRASLWEQWCGSFQIILKECPYYNESFKCKIKAMTIRMFKHPQNKQQQTLYLLKLAQTEALSFLRQWQEFILPSEKLFQAFLTHGRSDLCRICNLTGRGRSCRPGWCSTPRGGAARLDATIQCRRDPASQEEGRHDSVFLVVLFFKTLEDQFLSSKPLV